METLINIVLFVLAWSVIGFVYALAAATIFSKHLDLLRGKMRYAALLWFIVTLPISFPYGMYVTLSGYDKEVDGPLLGYLKEHFTWFFRKILKH